MGRLPPSDLISVIWFCFDKIIGQGKQKITFCRSQWRRNYNWLTIPQKETRKNRHNMQERSTWVPLGNYWEGFILNKLLSGLLVYRTVMPLTERLSSNFHSSPCCAFRPTAKRGLFTNYWLYTYCMVPRETVSFVYPRVLMKSRETLGLDGKRN